jgi:hypothetical protein
VRPARQTAGDVKRVGADRLAQPSNSRTLTVGEWEAKLAACGGVCVYCGKPPQPGRVLVTEHVEPLGQRGGEDVPENIAPACASCNSSKSDLFPLEWVLCRRGLWRRSQRGMDRTVGALRPRALPDPHWLYDIPY